MQDGTQIAPNTALGHYIIIDKIAEGGMGTVYKALEPELERHVAIKILHDTYAVDPQHQAQFLEEARSCAALRHANIVPLYFVGREGDLCYFAMAYIEGMTLDDWIMGKPPFDSAAALWFMAQAVAALQFATRFGIIHLDIKPANFMVDHDNNILLTDFGLARRKKEGEESGGELMGTPYYASPEHILQQEPDVRTDIYSLGATLYHLMTGEVVYEAETLEKICAMQVKDPFPMDRALQLGVPLGWACLMNRMMEKAPSFRFQSYDELLAAMADIENYRYGHKVISLPPVQCKRAIPRFGESPETLFGILPVELGPAQPGQYEITQTYEAAEVMDMLNKRRDVLNINKIADDIVELWKPATPQLNDLVKSMNQSEVYMNTVHELSSFLAQVYQARVGDDTARIELLGLPRAHNLALTMLMLQKPWQAADPLDWRGLWQHQICCGLVAEFMFDLLGYENGGYAYLCGLFHDVGKLIFAEIFGPQYAAVILHSLTNDIPLPEAEQEAFGLDHAQLGQVWMGTHNLNRTLACVTGCHDIPDEAAETLKAAAKREGFLRKTAQLLSVVNLNTDALAHVVCSANHLVKELGLGFSGNTTIEACKWEEHPSTQLLWDSRQDQEIEWEQFTGFFTQDCAQLPFFTIASYGFPSRAGEMSVPPLA
jgi:serine/threonine protein kinase